ncbi:MAG: YARHG domain-containing protein [Deltaproteobacteria bacterium]|nr:YARHG domain-containing protein [Deltaproteobacteria bacterium]
MYPRNILSILALLWLVILSPRVGNPDPATKTGAVLAEFEKLMAMQCNVTQFGISTPLEARILKNIPYAIVGRPFTSPELTELFNKDDGWYKPGSSSDVKIKPEHEACITRLQKREDQLRRSVKMDAEVERVFIRDPKIFLGLRAYPKATYKTTNTTFEKGKHWQWSAIDISPGSCGGDGSPNQRGDCAGIMISCELPENINDLKFLHCEIIPFG